MVGMETVVSAQKMILEKRNHKVKLTKASLQKIIIEEYVKDTFLDEAMSKKKAEQVLAWIRGEAPRPEWLTDDYGLSGKAKSGQSPNDSDVDRAAQTMPLPTGEMPQYDDEDVYDGGAYDPEAEYAPSVLPLEDQVTALVQDLQPEEMLDLFTAVIEKLAPEYIEPQRRQIGFREVKYIIQEVLNEVGDYHFGFGDEEKYDALDPHGFGSMSDAELIDMIEREGMEEILVTDGDGDLVNREEVIAALKNV